MSRRGPNKASRRAMEESPAMGSRSDVGGGIDQFLLHLAAERIISDAQLQLAKEALGLWRPVIQGTQERDAEQQLKGPAAQQLAKPGCSYQLHDTEMEEQQEADAEGPWVRLPNHLLDIVMTFLPAGPGTSSVRRTCSWLRSAFDRLNTHLVFKPAAGYITGARLQAWKLLCNTPNLRSLTMEDRAGSGIWSVLSYGEFLVGLETLCVGNVEDVFVGCLAQCTKLLHLEMRRCTVLEQLYYLESCRKLQHLDVSGGEQLETLDALSACVDLRHLNVAGCAELRGVGPLASCVELRHLDLSGCWRVEDIQPLASCPKLQHLQLADCRNVEDLAPLSALVGLRHLSLASCRSVWDIDPLSACVELQHLDLEGCDNILDFAPLASCVQLRSLVLSSCRVENLSPLAACVRLEYLDLTGLDNLTDLGPLAACVRLQQLGLGGCRRVQRLDPLAACVKMRYLDLDRSCAVESVAPLAALVELQCLDISGGREPGLDLQPLEVLPGLFVLSEW